MQVDILFPPRKKYMTKDYAMAQQEFSQSAAQPELTPDEVYREVLAGYRAVRSASPEDRLGQALNLLDSPAIGKTGQPWFVRDIAYACMENLPIKDRAGLSEKIDASPALQELATIYPRAALWYKTRERALAFEGEMQSPLRMAWQSARRTVIAGLEQAKSEGVAQVTLDVHSKISVQKLVQSSVLEAIAHEAPWSGLDIYVALADSHPAQGRREFAEKHLLGSEAFGVVSQECPQLAEYYEKRVAAMASTPVPQAFPSQDRAPQ